MKTLFYWYHLLVIFSPRKLHDNSVIPFGNTMTRFKVATNFFENLITFSPKELSSTERGIPTISRHSFLEYCALAQHCLSKSTTRCDSKFFTSLLLYFLNLRWSSIFHLVSTCAKLVLVLILIDFKISYVNKGLEWLFVSLFKTFFNGKGFHKVGLFLVQIVRWDVRVVFV